MAADTMKQVAAVIPHVEVDDIRLVKLASRLTDSLPESPHIVVAMGHDVAADVVEGILLVQVSYKLNAKVSKDATEPFFDLRATFQLAYQGENLASVGKEQWLAFASVNAVHNSWAYWRELVQSVSGRMGIPTLTVPLLKLRPAKHKKAQQSAPTE